MSKNTIAPIAIKTTVLNSTVLILLFLFASTQVVKADQVTFTTKIDNYYDWQGIQRDWTENNLLNYPIYDIIDNGNSYTIRKFNATSGNYDTVNLPKRNYLTYNFGIDTISVSGTILNQSQAVSITQPYNTTVRYLPLPFTASQIKSVTDDLIDMGLFQRYVNFNVIDSAGVEYNFEKHVIGDEIRLYFLTADFSTVTYPLYISERTIVVLLPNTASMLGYMGSAASEGVYGVNFPFGAIGTPTVLSASQMNDISNFSFTPAGWVNTTGSSSKDEFLYVNWTVTNVQSVNYIVVNARARGNGADNMYFGWRNYTGTGYNISSGPVATGTWGNATFNITGAANISYFVNMVGTTANFSTMVWSSVITNTAPYTISVDYFNATINYNPVPSYMPPAPINIASTCGNFYCNTTWAPGSGNITNGYNVSANGSWYNGTPTFYNTTLLPLGWSNVTVQSYNSSNGGTINTTTISKNSQAPGGINTTSWGNNATNNNSLSITVNQNDVVSFNLTTNQTINSNTTSIPSGVTSSGYSGVGTMNFYANFSFDVSGTKYVNLTVTNSSGIGTSDFKNWTVTVNPPLTDTSFTVTIPSGQSQSTGMYFNATNKSTKNVSASGQNSTSGWINVTNAGNVVLKFYINITGGSLPSGVSLKTDTDSDPNGAQTMNGALLIIINSLGIGASQSIWLWADYTNALPMTNSTFQTRVNSSTI